MIAYCRKHGFTQEDLDYPCRVCGSKENEEMMLLCDECDTGYHMVKKHTHFWGDFFNKKFMYLILKLLVCCNPL